MCSWKLVFGHAWFGDRQACVCMWCAGLGVSCCIMVMKVLWKWAINWVSWGISDSLGTACPWWQHSDHPLLGKPALPTAAGFLDNAECGVAQKEFLVVSPAAELGMQHHVLPNHCLALGAEGVWVRAFLSLRWWQIGQFLSWYTKPGQKRD